MAVCGAIFTTHPIVHRLTDYMWLGHSRVIDDHRTVELARVFYALRLGLADLRRYYDELSVPPEDVHRRFYPLADTCTLDSGEQLRFRYLRPLKGPDPSCATFLTVDCTKADRLLVVKFVERYGAAAHRLLAERSFAPNLLYCGDVWPTDAVPGGGTPRMMVVMDYVEGQSVEETDLIDAADAREEVHGAVRAALELLHKRGFVHGDIRAPNIMIEGKDDKDDKDVRKRVKIVDFDWAGIEGEVKYPLHLADARWPEGVEDYALIKADHDRAMADKLK